MYIQSKSKKSKNEKNRKRIFSKIFGGFLWKDKELDSIIIKTPSLIESLDIIPPHFRQQQLAGFGVKLQ